MRFLVTGATGLVGLSVVDRALESGHTVTALVRSASAAEALRRPGVSLHHGDLSDPANLRAAVQGVDVVVHSAAVVDVAGAPEGMWDVNVHGTQRLLEAAAETGVHRFVHVSSTAVYGHAPSPIREDAPKQPVGLYGRSKWAAEEVVWRYHRERGVPAVALRPCVIYGEHGRDRHAAPMLERMGRMRVVPLPRGGRALLDFVHVTDVAEAVLGAVASRAAVGHAYNLTDGESHSYRDILLAYEQAAGKRPAVLPVPRPLFRAATALGRLRRVRVLDTDVHYSIDAAIGDLGYRPRVGLRDGLRLLHASKVT
jgi:nucleoside-diphosphate-sugar epimerase